MEPLKREEIALLAPHERLELIGLLWDSLEGDEVPLPSWQCRELDRRLSTLEEDRRRAMPWAEVKADLARRRR